ncbi:MAG: hypothetical protein FD123_1295 [Bacteroidetes bacterium]|nr:MAG: hypothetical protein FD123_1295 [Bacteroidota bacterium]
MPGKDSVLNSKATAVADTIPGTFISVKEPVINPLPRPESTEYWIPGTLLFSFVLIVFLHVFDGRRFTQLLAGFVRMASVSQFYREEFSLTNRVSFLLTLNFLLTGGLFLYQALVFFGGEPAIGGALLFGILAGALLATYLVKLFALRVIGYIFQVQEVMTEYGYNVLLFNKTLGLLLFPVSVLIAFAVQLEVEWLVWTGFVLWSMILVYRILRGVMLAIQVPGISAFNLFLYLCTLEILPFVVITKVFISNF